MAQHLIPRPTSADCIGIFQGKEKGKKDFLASLFFLLYFLCSRFPTSTRGSCKQALG